MRNHDILFQEGPNIEETVAHAGLRLEYIEKQSGKDGERQRE